MGSAGIGSAGHLAGELLQMMTGVKLVHVPYRGNAPALTDLIAGQVQLVFPSSASSIEYVRTGKVRGLAVTGCDPPRCAARSADRRRFRPGLRGKLALWDRGAAQHAGRQSSTSSTRRSTRRSPTRSCKARLADLGGTPFGGSPADFGKLMAEETEKWGKVVKFAGIKPQ